MCFELDFALLSFVLHYRLHPESCILNPHHWSTLSSLFVPRR
jgi:hypothetical protein